MTAALALLAPLTPALAAPAPSPAPSPALREIEHLHATTPYCRALVTQAVSAIEIETANNARLVTLEDTMNSLDFDTSLLAKAKSNAEITRQYVALRAAAVEGNGLLKQFREQAKDAPTEDQRAALTAFVDALDGALHRQKQLADAVGRFVAYVDAHEPIDKATHDAMVDQAIRNMGNASIVYGPFDPRYFGPTEGIPEPLTTIAKDGAKELAHRALPIQNDENDAAQRMDPAFAHC
jgi:hypothetical protein